ncbi:YcbK family protein [Sphingomonas gilva]|nr:DUF882 domain-containing protein [Sphingomonas gilva]
MLLPGGLGSATRPFLPVDAATEPSAPPPLPEKRIAFRSVNTGERIDARYFNANGWDAEGLAEINHGLRDWRTGEVFEIDRKLIALLTDLRDTLEVAPRTAFDLISGYRSPATNSSLRKAGGAHTGVATKSQHMLGKAADIALPGIPLDRLRSAARAAQKGGVGFYPVDGFVHVDTGRVRFW